MLPLRRKASQRDLLMVMQLELILSLVAMGFMFSSIQWN